MANAISQWKKRINECSLPILSSTAQYFTRQKNKPGATISGLWKKLQYDPGMCLNLLRAAGHSRQTRVTTVNHAMLLLGLPNVLNRPKDLAKIEDIKDTTIRELLLKNFSNSFHASIQSNRWSQIRKDSAEEELQTASLVSQFIDYLICSSEPDLFYKLIKTERQGINKAEAEKKILNVSRRELAYEIAKDWRLPELIMNAQKHSNDQPKKIRQVYLAQRLAEEVEKGWYHEDISEIYQSISEFLHSPLENVIKDIHKTAVVATRLSKDVYYPVPGPAAKLNEVKILPGNNNTAPSKQQPDTEAILKKYLRQIRENKNLSYDYIMNQSFKALRDGLGLDRVFFSLLTDKKQFMKVKHVLEKDGNKTLKGLRLPLEKNSLFEQLIRLPGAVWMNDSNRDRYKKFLPEQFVEQLASPTFFARSIFIQGKSVGMFFADSPGTGKLTEIKFKYFKDICQTTEDALNQITDQNGESKVVNG